MREHTDRPDISLPLQSHSDITEEPRQWEPPSFRHSISLSIAKGKHQPMKVSRDCEQDHEHIEKIDGSNKSTYLDVRRCSLGSSTTIDTVELVRKIAAGDRNLPNTTTIAATEKPKLPRPKRWLRKTRILCSIFALVALIVIPVVCICILTGVFVPDEARTEHGKATPATTKVSESESRPSTTIYTSTVTTTDTPDVTWLATATTTGLARRENADGLQRPVPNPSLRERTIATEPPTTMETRPAKTFSTES